MLFCYVFPPWPWWHAFRSSDSLLVPTFLTYSPLWAMNYHLHSPTFPLRNHHCEENVPTSSQQMADHDSTIYDCMLTHGIRGCISHTIPSWAANCYHKSTVILFKLLILLTSPNQFILLSFQKFYFWSCTFSFTHLLRFPSNLSSVTSYSHHFLSLRPQPPSSCQICEPCLTTLSWPF